MVADVEEEQRQIEMYEARSMSLDGAGGFGGAIYDADVDMAEEQEEEPAQNGGLANDNRVNSSDNMTGQQDIDMDVMAEIRHPQRGRSLNKCIQLMQPIVQTLAYCASHDYDLEIQRMALAREINRLSDEAEMEKQEVAVRKQQAGTTRLQAERDRARVAAENELLNFQASQLDIADITTPLISEHDLRAKVWTGELHGEKAMAALNIRLGAIADYNHFACAGEEGRSEAESVEASRLIGVVMECMHGKSKYEPDVKGYTGKLCSSNGVLAAVLTVDSCCNGGRCAR